MKLYLIYKNKTYILEDITNVNDIYNYIKYKFKLDKKDFYYIYKNKIIDEICEKRFLKLTDGEEIKIYNYMKGGSGKKFADIGQLIIILLINTILLSPSQFIAQSIKENNCSNFDIKNNINYNKKKYDIKNYIKNENMFMDSDLNNCSIYLNENNIRPLNILYNILFIACYTLWITKSSILLIDNNFIDIIKKNYIYLLGFPLYFIISLIFSIMIGKSFRYMTLIYCIIFGALFFTKFLKLMKENEYYSLYPTYLTIATILLINLFTYYSGNISIFTITFIILLAYICTFPYIYIKIYCGI